MSELHCDVLVVGGGPAGSAAALTVRSHGLQVVMLEASGYEAWRAGETLLPRVRDPLTTLQLPGLLDEVSSLPSYGNRSAWGSEQLESHSFFGGLGAHGYHVDRRKFDAALAARCENAGVDVRRGARLRSLHPLRDGAFEATDALGTRVLASAIIDASGKTASAATRLGGRRERLDKLIAVVAQFPIPEPHCCTLVEAARDGWWYSAPIPGQRLIVAQLTDSDTYTGAEHRGAFLDRLQRTTHTRARLGPEQQPIAAPKIVAACSQRLRPQPGARRWLAVGDAAFSADPLSGTGVQRALESGTSGAHALLAMLAGNTRALDHFDQQLDHDYARYVQQRQAFYTSETRFPHHPFWQRRTASGSRAVGFRGLRAQRG